VAAALVSAALLTVLLFPTIASAILQRHAGRAGTLGTSAP
jgi:hypothetical protein